MKNKENNKITTIIIMILVTTIIITMTITTIMYDDLEVSDNK